MHVRLTNNLPYLMNSCQRLEVTTPLYRLPVKTNLSAILSTIYYHDFTIPIIIFPARTTFPLMLANHPLKTNSKQQLSTFCLSSCIVTAFVNSHRPEFRAWKIPYHPRFCQFHACLHAPKRSSQPFKYSSLSFFPSFRSSLLKNCQVNCYAQRSEICRML